MTILFSDSFNGATGTIQGRVPETTSGSGTWNNGYLVATNGSAAYFSGSGATSVGGYASCGYGANPYGYSATSPGAGTISGNFTTPSVVTPNADGFRGISLGASLTNSSGGNKDFSVRVYSVAGSGVWTLALYLNGSIVSSNTISISASTAYDVTITFDSSSVSAVCNGVTVSSAVAYTGYLVGSLNLNDVGIGFLLNAISMTSAVVIGSLNGSFTSPSPQLASSGTSGNVASAAGTAPSATATGSVLVGRLASVSASAPPPLLSSTMNEVVMGFNGSAPMGSISASLSRGTIASLSATASLGVLAAFFGTNAAVAPPAPSLAASGTSTALVQASLSPPSGVLQAGATLSETATASVSPPVGLVRAYGGVTAQLTASSIPTLAASVGSGNVASAAVAAPSASLVAASTSQNSLGATLLAPRGFLLNGAASFLTAPSASLFSAASPTVVVSYEAYALNLNHRPRGREEPVDELTHYTNFPFDKIVRYKNSYYGVNRSGLFMLEGLTDDGAPIGWDVKTCMTDFSSVYLKTITSAYFGGRLGEAATVSLHVGELGAQTYSYTTPLGTDAQNYRQTFGKGVKDRYYALEVQGVGAFTLDSITLLVSELSRRI